MEATDTDLDLRLRVMVYNALMGKVGVAWNPWISRSEWRSSSAPGWRRCILPMASRLADEVSWRELRRDNE